MATNHDDIQAETVAVLVEFTFVHHLSSSFLYDLLIFSSGGLELLFSNQRKHQLSLPSSDEEGQAANLAFLVRYLCENVMKDTRRDMFLLDGTV